MEALSAALEHPAPDFLKNFHEQWFDLEQVFAVALDRRDEDVVADNNELIQRALEVLSSLVAEQLQACGPEDGGG